MSETKEKISGTAAIPPELMEDVEQAEPASTAKPVEPNYPDVSNAADGTPERKEHTRSRMAILFVLGFYAILFLCFVYAIMVGAKLSDLKDTLVGVIGALSGILGFIVGYYYKSSQEP